MKERPMLMNAPMVRAILAGTKTQTRRVVKYAAPDLVDADGWPLSDLSDRGAGEVRAGCPYGQPEDRLWVRERWMPVAHDTQPYRYMATNQSYAGKWRPSIHMPRAASRITLEIVSVRVEKLQDISRGDALAEGCPFPNMAKETDPRRWFADLWESINGPGSWDANPWVWVIEFKQVQA